MEEKIAASFKRRTRLHILGDDRALLQMQTESEMIQGIDAEAEVFKVCQWGPEVQWEDRKIACQQEWIGVQGLPIELWTLETFNIIGEACGGLRAVSTDKLHYRMLRYAKLEVEGGSDGFLSEYLVGAEAI